MARASIPPDLAGNRCRIAGEWVNQVSQRLWFVAAPYGGSVLRFRGEPTSLLYAIAPTWASVLRGEVPGLDWRGVALLNPGVSSDAFYTEFEARLQRQNLRMIGVSALTASSEEARRLAVIVRRVSPQTLIVFGGPHEDDVTQKTSVTPSFAGHVDVSVAGDGEFALLELVKLAFCYPDDTPQQLKARILLRAGEFRNCTGIGTLFLNHDGASHEVNLSQRAVSMDGLPRMPRELVHEADGKTFAVFKRAGRNVRTAQIMTQRGCAWRCSFCSESASLNSRSIDSVVAEVDEVLSRGYEAVFFDDSTFTTRSRRRREFLGQLYPALRERNLEWGCQTRLDQIDVPTLQGMKDAGCSYVYVGLESASEEMLRAMVKDQGKAAVEDAFRAARDVGMRLGVSLLFGAAQPGMRSTAETTATITETLEFVERQCRGGNIIFVSPNLATFYPGTRMTASAGAQVDFTKPIVHEGYPWNRFEEGEGYHADGVDEHMASFIIEEGVRRFGEFIVEQDLYAINEIQEAYREGAFDGSALDVIDLNAASICRPVETARDRATHWATHAWAGVNQAAETEAARRDVAEIMGLPVGYEHHVAFTPNATDAVRAAFELARALVPGRRHVLVTDAENLSVTRVFSMEMEHANRDGRDLWCSYQDYGALSEGVVFRRKQRADVDVEVVPVMGAEDELPDRLVARIRPDTAIVAFSHVVRDTGRILPVGQICKAIRRVNRDCLILVDGAQALGALTEVNVDGQGCDFYVAAPHKTLGSLPVGLLYMGDRVTAGLRPATGAPVFRVGGMISPHLAIPAEGWLSMPELVSLRAALGWLEAKGLRRGHRFAGLTAKRAGAKVSINERLGRLESVELLSPVTDTHSSFISAFRFRGMDNRSVVEHLWREQLVLSSYIARSNLIRLSLPVDFSQSAVGRALSCFERAGTRDVETKGRLLRISTP